jgi:hypothetical protein
MEQSFVETFGPVCFLRNAAQFAINTVENIAAFCVKLSGTGVTQFYIYIGLLRAIIDVVYNCFYFDET